MFSSPPIHPSDRPATPAASGPPTAGSVEQVSSGQIVYEQLPREIQLLVGDDVMALNRETPAANTVPVFASLKSELAAVHREQVEATDLTRPLWTAETPEEFIRALKGLARAPFSQRAWCWDSVVPALSGLLSSRAPQDAGSALSAVLAHLPADPALRLRLLHQTVDVVQRLPDRFEGMQGAVFAACAAEPQLPDQLWRRLLRSMVGWPPHLFDRPMMEAAGAALAPARRAELELMMDILRLPLLTRNGAVVEALAQRIGALRPGPVGMILYHQLFVRLERSRATDFPVGVSALYRALLAAAEAPGCREDALALLPVVLRPTPQHRAVLLRHLEQLPPEAAMKFLVRQLPTFATDPQRMPPQCAERLQSARGRPAEHAALIRILARAMPDVQSHAKRQDLGRLLLAEVPVLPLADRLPVLAALDPCVAPEPGDSPSSDWLQLWDRSLRATCHAVQHHSEAVPVREGIRALAAALPREEREGRVPQPRDCDHAPDFGADAGPLLGALATALQSLPLHRLAEAICDIVQVYGDEGHLPGPSSATLRLLVHCCSGLPFELRAKPLQALQTATERAEQDDWRIVNSLVGATQEEQQAWRAQAVAEAARKAALAS
ncbi:hypothetical protein [Xylophilus sp. GOD-11R]|uniref:hypothetical protein n=1 Tax=Xylophilus sp. GOD-11R TaxID=3089814 RepID=UPI00298D5354|nr:hypothetical protein [Xylophilus sp. GOD-11R]WPB57973.1 hypothetical protein R9X41_04820 [Xylophilus sp. GOD-11R]